MTTLTLTIFLSALILILSYILYKNRKNKNKIRDDLIHRAKVRSLERQQQKLINDECDEYLSSIEYQTSINYATLNTTSDVSLDKYNWDENTINISDEQKEIIKIIETNSNNKLKLQPKED